jgi:C-terminal processing protease CtpA/Prc
MQKNSQSDSEIAAGLLGDTKRIFERLRDSHGFAGRYQKNLKKTQRYPRVCWEMQKNSQSDSEIAAGSLGDANRISK